MESAVIIMAMTLVQTYVELPKKVLPILTLRAPGHYTHSGEKGEYIDNLIIMSRYRRLLFCHHFLVGRSDFSCSTVISGPISKETPAAAKFHVAGMNAGPAVHTGDVSPVLPRHDLHETGGFAAPAVGAFSRPCDIHPHPQRERADPAEEHLHKPRGTDKFAERVPHKD